MMPIYVRNIELGLNEPPESLLSKAAARLKISPDAIRSYATVRRSLDARRKDDPCFVYCLELALDSSIAHEGKVVQRLHRSDVTMLQNPPMNEPRPGSIPMPERPVVVGFGPAGMFAGYRLAQMGYRPIILERGQPVRVRHKDIIQKYYREGFFNAESNLLYGEGGAGAYSDGKLYTRVNHPSIELVLRILYQHGANPDILIDGKPHIGSDRLPNICIRIRKRIESLGGEVRFGSRVDELVLNQDGQVTAVVIDGQALKTRHLLLAIGHSAQDTIQMLAGHGVNIIAKPFQMGVRIEHPQSLVDAWQYGPCAGDERLPPADYHAVAKGAAGQAGDVFTFCMCPGGMILPTHESPRLIATNGASRSLRSGPFANSGLVMTIDPQVFGHDPLAGLAYQRRWESLAFQATGGNYAVPAQRAGDYLAGRRSDGELRTSYPLGATWADIRSMLPSFVADGISLALHKLDKKFPGFGGEHGIITAPETRASAPVRIVRHPDRRESVSHPGLYPIGEGAGYAGGIMSAAVDGIKTADLIINTFATPR